MADRWSIVQHPTDQFVEKGEIAVFQCIAERDDGIGNALTYHWYRIRDENEDGAYHKGPRGESYGPEAEIEVKSSTSFNFNFVLTDCSANATYMCRVKALDGRTQRSQLARLIIATRPQFRAQPPPSMRATEGQALPLKVALAAPSHPAMPPATFQWTIDGLPVPGATKATLC